MVDAFEYAHKHRDKVVWMSQNTNQLVNSAAIRKAILESANAEEYQLYPPPSGLVELKDAVADDLKIDLKDLNYDILITFGGTEAIYVTLRALLKEKMEVVTTDPSYLIIHKFVHLMGCITTDLPIYTPPWRYELNAVKDCINKNTKFILLINPLNPLGSLYTKDEVRAICELAADNNLYVLDDITYRDFAEKHHLALEFLPEKTLTAYSVSKNCGLAGMRVGALIGNKELLATIKPYVVSELSVNIIGQRAAVAALRTKKKWFPEVKKITFENQRIIKSAVDKTDGVFLPVYPSQTNMFVIDVAETGIDPVGIQNKLLYEHNIFVRAGNYVSQKFGKRFIRTSFSVPKKGVEKFAAVFPQVMEELKG